MPIKISVKDKAELNELALKFGATVTDSSGAKFNTSRTKARKRLNHPDEKPALN